MARHSYTLEEVKRAMRERLRDEYKDFVHKRMQSEYDDFLRASLKDEYDDAVTKGDKYVRERLGEDLEQYELEAHEHMKQLLDQDGWSLHELLGKDEHDWDNLDVGNKCAKLLLFQNPNLLEMHKHFVRPRIMHQSELLEPMQIRDAIKCQMLRARQGQGLKMSLYFYGAIRSDGKSCRHVVQCFESNTMSGNQYLGCVVNTSKALDVGGHWIVVGVDNVRRTVEYWDPMGRPPRQDNPMLTHIYESDTFREYDLIVSETTHQQGGTECGVYCIYYICSRVILGKSMSDINATPVRDADMQKYWRAQFFR